MKTNLYILILFLMEIGMLVGCSADGIPEETDGNRPGGLTCIRFGLEGAYGQVVATDGEQVIRLETGSANTGENTLQNLTVLQFDLDQSVTDVTTQDAAICVTARYLRAPEPEKDESATEPYYLIGLQASKKDTQYLIFIANAGSAFQNFEGKTLGDFKGVEIPFDQKTNNGENQLMLAALYVPVKGVEDQTIHPVELKRLVAQVHFKYTKSLAGVVDADFTPLSLRLRNVPKVLKYADGITEATDYPEKTAANFTDYTFIIDQVEDGFTWYIPQNVRTATDALPSGDSFHTYVELSGIYKAPNMPDQLVTYRFYVGQGSPGYNVYRNYDYEILPVLRGVNSFDSRVTRRNLVLSPPANCFVLSPESGSEVTFNPYLAPGTDVGEVSVCYTDQVKENRYSRIAAVKTVWQTADGLIDVSFGEGVVRVQPNTAGTNGNALIAAYDADNTILWSWHIWVTPYAKVLDGTGKNGYIYDFGGYTWMDRNLGALNVFREDNNRNLYYQWGRKDPFYDTGKTTVTGTGISSANKGTALNIDESIKCPTVFFTHQSTTGTWHGGTAAIPNLWFSDTKTVFDPCPAGWRVPAKAAWDAYKWGSDGNIAWDTTNSYGAVLTVNSEYSWFPRGVLGNSNMTFNASNTYMWSALCENGFPRTFSFTSSGGSIVNDIAGSFGGSVRCVKEK